MYTTVNRWVVPLKRIVDLRKDPDTGLLMFNSFRLFPSQSPSLDDLFVGGGLELELKDSDNAIVGIHEDPFFTWYSSTMISELGFVRFRGSGYFKMKDIRYDYRGSLGGPDVALIGFTLQIPDRKTQNSLGRGKERYRNNPIHFEGEPILTDGSQLQFRYVKCGFNYCLELARVIPPSLNNRGAHSIDSNMALF